jgi:hypothetical protein
MYLLICVLLNKGHVPVVLINCQQNAVQVCESVLDMVTRGILEGKCTQQDVEQKDIIQCCAGWVTVPKVTDS